MFKNHIFRFITKFKISNCVRVSEAAFDPLAVLPDLTQNLTFFKVNIFAGEAHDLSPLRSNISHDGVRPLLKTASMQKANQHVAMA
ncbi:MAG: hypothetical protein A2503_12445 [Burkholderiales bacterium RIFOXYD12_FULL_59_19]|nr:MAG: hypothetical protein A2503_12445 [Burkholderiales bacterium RIFOXYD12_FULL_59_19]